jgi:hypothetical protein
VVLLGDIDMSGVTEWTPIGDVGFTWASNKLTITGTPFTGYFDGQGHKITGFKAVCANSKTGGAWGLFGCVADGGIVENLVIDASCDITVAATNQTEFGVVAGIVLDGTVRNITNNAAVKVTKMPSANTRLTVGMVGFAYGKEGARIENLVNNGVMTTSVSSASNSYYAGGIVGLATVANDTEGKLVIKDCVFNGDIVSSQSNPGAGIVSLVDQPGIVFQGCKSKGRIVTDRALTDGLVGTFLGTCEVATTFTDCVSSAQIAKYNGGSWNYYTVGASNYLDYVGKYSSGSGVSSTGIRFTE